VTCTLSLAVALAPPAQIDMDPLNVPATEQPALSVSVTVAV
jgi:hypothetical protein